MMDNVNPESIPYRWGARALMLVILSALLLLIRLGWKRNKFDYNHEEEN